MSASLRLSVPDLGDAVQAAEFFGIADAARRADGADPFNEQSRLDVAAGRRSPVLGRVEGTVAPGSAVGAAILGRGELDLVVDPGQRRNGYATRMLDGVLRNVQGPVTAWSHGDHPGARALATRFGFTRVRTLLQLALPLGSAGADVLGDAEANAVAGFEVGRGYSTAAFRPGVDEPEWVALNAAVFAAHPEQGSITAHDLEDRMAEPWFDADDFLVARDAAGRMVGYNWLKVERAGDAAAAEGEAAPPLEGEIYAIGVDEASAGHGLGRALMHAGLERLRRRGCATATLYVEGDNERALHLYRSLGFVDHAIDVQYRRD